MRNNPTAPERILWAYLRRNQLGRRFHRQALMFGYIVDFWCPAKRLVVEIDGKPHRTVAAQVYDQRRDAIMEAAGIRVLRVWAGDVFNNSGRVVRQIVATCGELNG